MTLFRLLCVLTGVASLSACVGVREPATIGADVLTYNEAITTSAREQLLLNIVRLRYRDTINFVQVSGVTADYEVSVATQLSADVSLSGGNNSLDPLGRAEFSKSPIVRYEPLQGREYATRLLEPVAAEKLLLLAQSGWSAERVLLCCVARVGAIENAQSASGPTPDVFPDNRLFRALAADLRTLQQQNALQLSVDTSGETAALRATVSGDTGPARRVRAFFDADADDPDGFANTATVNARSVLGILTVLSQTVEVPDAHRGSLTTDTQPSRDPAPSPMFCGPMGAAELSDFCAPATDWQDVFGDYFAVRHSPTRPRNAAVSVEYRGHWFYVDDTDLSAKSTFDLVSILFALQAAGGQSSGMAPLVVIGAGN